MSPKERQFQGRIRTVSDALGQRAEVLHFQILRRLLDSHRDKEFLQGLSDAVRRRDGPAILDHADLLSSQKYEDATSHFVANQFALLIKKYPWDPRFVKTDPLRVAEDSFFSANKRCRRVNSKFRFLMNDPGRDKFYEESRTARGFIRQLVGDVPAYRKIFRKSDFGKGASVGVHGDATHILRKLSSEQEWSCTPGAIHHGFGGIVNNFHYSEVLLQTGGADGLYCYDYEDAFKRYLARIHVVNSNKLSFVLKTAKTHRVVATEPLVNGLAQKGVDVELRRKLRQHTGIDLSDQSQNQDMAREGSTDDSPEGFVTLDLKNASNSVARGPVEYLWPEDWVRLFNNLRSPNSAYLGEEFILNMLCSMGNGFCFPVETIMFVAICVGCGCGVPNVDFRVYGDDIIVRRKHASKVIEMLDYYGFKLNMDKSFTEGPFRESCGSDWFQGQDVRPFTLDYRLDSIESCFKFLNLTRRSERTSEFFACVRHLVIGAIPADFRFFRPLVGNPDSGIDVIGDEHLTSEHCHYRNGMWSWSVLVQRPVVDRGRLGKLRSEPWLMGIVLRGTASIGHGALAGLPEVTFRRRTRAEVVREGYSSTSNWLPTVWMSSQIPDFSLRAR